MISTEKYKYLENIESLKILESSLTAILTFLNGIFLFIIMSQLKIFRSVLNIISKIFSSTKYVFLIYIISLLFFQCIAMIIAGDSASPIASSFSIYKILDSLIKSNSFKDFTLDYKFIFIYLLFIPYFIFVEFTLFSILLSIIYHTLIISYQSKKKNKKTKQQLTFKQFFINTFTHIKNLFIKFKVKSSSKNLEKLAEFKSGIILKFSVISRDPFNLIVTNLNYLGKKNNIELWTRLLGETLIEEYLVRKKLNNQLVEILILILQIAIDHKNFYFISDCSEKNVVFNQLNEIFENFTRYYKKGHFKLENFHSFLIDKNKKFLKSIEDKNNEEHIQKLKQNLLVLSKQVDFFISKINQNNEITQSKNILKKHSSSFNIQ